jgi:hypothetical protein
MTFNRYAHAQAIGNPNKVNISGRQKTKWRKYDSRNRLKLTMPAREVPYSGCTILSFSHCCIYKKSLKIQRGNYI